MVSAMPCRPPHVLMYDVYALSSSSASEDQALNPSPLPPPAIAFIENIATAVLWAAVECCVVPGTHFLPPPPIASPHQIETLNAVLFFCPSDAGEDAGQPPREASQDGVRGRVSVPRPVLVGRAEIRVLVRQPRVLRFASELAASTAGASGLSCLFSPPGFCTVAAVLYVHQHFCWLCHY